MEDNKKVAKSFLELGLCLPLVEACDILGWKIPSKIQAQAIPRALGAKDLVGLAPKGCGKTGAFALSILQCLFETPQTFFACVLSPNRGRATQIAELFEALGYGIGMKCALLVEGMDHVQQSIALRKRPHIVVATHGRLVVDLVANNEGFSLHTLEILVLDEADRLLNEDFGKIIEKLLNVIPRERKTYIFSATMTKEVQRLQSTYLRNAVKIKVSSMFSTEDVQNLLRFEDSSMLSTEDTLQKYCCIRPNRHKIEASSDFSTVDTLKQFCCIRPYDQKDCYLVYILTEMSGSTSTIFTREDESSCYLTLLLRTLGFRAISINGQMSHLKRLGALNKFKAGECNILVCTDEACRGLEIPSVDMVYNYNIPPNPEDYGHRVGGTAEAGVAIWYVSEYELDWYMQMEKRIDQILPYYLAKDEDVLKQLDRVTEAGRTSEKKIREMRRKMREKGGGNRRKSTKLSCNGRKSFKKHKQA